MLSLANQIHLWFARDHDCTPQLLAQYRQDLLSDEERAREVRFHFEHDRNQFVLTRALVRSVLSRYAHISPRAWRFGKNEFGRPFIANAEGPALSFNLSHTKGMVVMAVSAPQAIGVDVENYGERAAPLDVAGHFFSPLEAKQLYALPKEAQQERFFHYWTLKEAYIKAEGKGLTIPLDEFSMDLRHPETVDICFHADIHTGADPWRFCLLRSDPGFLTALCVQTAARSMPELVLHRYLPLQKEEVFQVPLLRSSVWEQ